MKKLIQSAFLLIAILFNSCDDSYIPKPIGLFRIDIPNYQYLKYDNKNVPYIFEYAEIAQINRRFDKDSSWINISYPEYKATLFLTYHTIDTTLASYIEDCHSMAYKHTSKATNIETEPVIIDSNHVYGLVYFIEGDQAASPLNFYLTDSVNNFLRGALYFNIEPKNDSLRPVIESIEKDVKIMISGFRFRNSM